VAVVGRGVGAVADRPAGRERARARIIGAGDEGGRLRGELRERAVVVRLGREDVHMVVIDVRDDGDLRLHRQGRAVVLIRLDDGRRIASDIRVRA